MAIDTVQSAVAVRELPSSISGGILQNYTMNKKWACEWGFFFINEYWHSSHQSAFFGQQCQVEGGSKLPLEAFKQTDGRQTPCLHYTVFGIFAVLSSNCITTATKSCCRASICVTKRAAMPISSHATQPAYIPRIANQQKKIQSRSFLVQQPGQYLSIANQTAGTWLIDR